MVILFLLLSDSSLDHTSMDKLTNEFSVGKSHDKKLLYVERFYEEWCCKMLNVIQRMAYRTMVHVLWIEQCVLDPFGSTLNYRCYTQLNLNRY